MRGDSVPARGRNASQRGMHFRCTVARFPGVASRAAGPLIDSQAWLTGRAIADANCDADVLRTPNRRQRQSFRETSRAR